MNRTFPRVKWLGFGASIWPREACLLAWCFAKTLNDKFFFMIVLLYSVKAGTSEVFNLIFINRIML